MIPLPEAADWETLGIEPTADAAAVRRAYRERLREVGSEADPEGFKHLRSAYEKILASVENNSASKSRDDGKQAAPIVAIFLAELRGRRTAGQEQAAIAWVDEALAAHRPGSAVAEALEDGLLEELALSRNVSPGLFLHLADRLDWRDIQGRAARKDPERHAMLLDRIAAEDWYHALRHGEGDGDADRRLGALMTFDRERAAASLRQSPIDPAQRQQVRELFQKLMSHATFVLGRFDGGTLGLLRETVEGPPLLGEGPVPGSPVAAPASSSAPAPSITDLVSPKRRLLIRYGVVAAIVVGVVGKVFYPSKSSVKDVDTALSASAALPLLKSTETAWIDLVPGPDGMKVDYATVMRLRRAIKELHVGYNDEAPTTLFSLPDTDVPIGFPAPDYLKRMSMRIQYSDGTWSEVRRYDIQKAKP